MLRGLLVLLRCASFSVGADHWDWPGVHVVPRREDKRPNYHLQVLDMHFLEYLLN